ncbi:MAG: hypothetical protein AMJ90_08630 [candidate division Zixibacteria bacterium SM23_73_2]|nr:MAG: hypothetical protein AMJ90_08630 [candidate division Zixibacteria bacterium SM23_73_2]
MRKDFPEESNYHNTIKRLKDLRNSYIQTKLVFGILLLLSSVFALWIFAFILNSIFVLPTFIRLIYLGFFFLVISVLISYFFLRILIFKPPLESLAIKVEEEFPQLKNRLISSLQLYTAISKNPFGYSIDMIKAVIKQADEFSSKSDLKKVVDKNPLKKISRVTVGLVLIFTLFAFVFPSTFNFCFYVFSHPLTQIEIPRKFVLEVFPKDQVVSKFSEVEIMINAVGEEKPEKMDLFWKNEGGSWDREELKRKTQDARIKMQDESEGDYDFGYTFKEVKRSFYYYAESEGISSSEYRITVVDKPRVTGLKLLFDFPSYTGLEDVLLDGNDGNITAIYGTRVKLEARANKDLDSAFLVFEDSKKSLEVKKNKAIGDMLVEKDRTYHIELTDSSGYQNEEPIEYQIISIPDQYPEIQVIEPAQNQDLNESMELYLVTRISDDYGFSSLKLVYQIISGGVEGQNRTSDIPLDGVTGKDTDVGYLWNLDRMDLVPEDVVRYRLDVYDNDVISGPKKSSSKTYMVRLPSLAEILADLDQKREKEIFDMEKVLKEEKKLQEELEDFAKKMLSQKEVDWGKKKEMEEFLKTQEKIQEKLKDLSERIDQTGMELEENKLATLELMEKMEELKKLLDQIASPELKEAMRKLQEALEKLDPEKVKEALAQMEFSLEEMIEKIDRTISLLKRLKAEQQLENLLELAERLSEKQKQINESLGTCNKEGCMKLSEDEEDLLKELNEMDEDLKDWGDLMKELAPDLEKPIDELSSSLEQGGLKEDMKSLSSALSQCNKQKSSQLGSMCESKLDQLLINMKSFKQLFQQCQMAELTSEMRKILFDLFYLSDKQEGLLEETEVYQNTDFGLRDMAEDEQDLKSGALRVDKDLEVLSKKSFFVTPDIRRQMSLALASIESAVKRLDERNKDAAFFSQRDAIYNINQTAKKLLEALGSASSSCCGSGLELLFQKMEKLAQSQAIINEKTFGFENLSEGLSQEQQQALQRLAAEQEGVRKSMEELAREFGDRKQIMGSLEDLEKQLREVVKDMEGRNITDKTLRVQEKILSRLLDAEKSLAQRDYSKQRKAEAGEDIFGITPEALPGDLAERDRIIKENLEKILKENYPKEYEKLIIEYFKRLSEAEALKR